MQNRIAWGWNPSRGNNLTQLCQRSARAAMALKSPLLVGALLIMGVSAFAAPITGAFGTTATGVIAFADAGGIVHKIDFCPPNAGSPSPTGISGSCTGSVAPAGQGFLNAQGGTGTFSSLVALTPGTILDMVDQNGNPPFTFFPVGIPNQNINNFITVSTFPSFNFQADQFVNQTCATTATVSCLGGFVLTQVGTDVSVSFTVNGEVIAAGFDTTPFTYIITGQFNNNNINAVAAAANTPGGIFSNTWSGSLAMNPVPEPGTITMLAIGAMAMCFCRMRSQRRSNSN